MKTYAELKEELSRNYPMVSPYHYWIISSPLIYPSICIYADESTRIFDHGDSDFDVSPLNDISFEKCTVYQCDGLGGTDVEEGHNLSKFVLLPAQYKKRYAVRFVFDCSRYGSIYREIECMEENFRAAYKHELTLARIRLNLAYDEPSMILNKEEI